MACGSKQERPIPDDDYQYPLPKDSMVSFLVELHLAEGIVASQMRIDTAITAKNLKIYQGILNTYRVSKDRAKGSFRYYSYRPEQMQELLESCTDSLSRLVEQLSRLPGMDKLPMTDSLPLH